eukprot:3582-Heterococcus_DN1.PRE.2
MTYDIVRHSIASSLTRRELLLVIEQQATCCCDHQTLNTTASCCWRGIAINAANESPLQLICNNCDVQSVQLLLDAGGWLTCNGFKCPLGATRAGNAEVLELLLSAATATAATTASNSGSSGSSDSSSVQMCCIQATTATSGLTLLHVAAAVRSLSCAKLPVRHGVHATALPPDLEATELEPVDFDKFALMLLSCGATVKPKCCFCRPTEQFAVVQQKHSQRQQQQISSRARVAAVHAAASWYELGDNSSSSSSSIADFVQIQLVHTVTGQRGAKLYTVDIKLLAQLYASAVTAAAAATVAATTAATGDSSSSRENTTTATTTATAGASSAGCNNSSATTVSSTGSNSSSSSMLAVQQSVSMKMIVTPEGWQSTIENGVKLISYDVCIREKGASSCETGGSVMCMTTAAVLVISMIFTPCCGLTLCSLQPTALMLCYAGAAFNERGFDNVMEYLYTGAVHGVTVGRLDIDKLQSALLAAEFFHVDALAQDARDWAALCGVEIDASSR